MATRDNVRRPCPGAAAGATSGSVRVVSGGGALGGTRAGVAGRGRTLISTWSPRTTH